MITKIIGYAAGIISLVYFGIYTAFAGLTNKFTYFWLLFGVFCILMAAGRKHIRRLWKIIPLALRVLVSSVIGICLAALIIAEGLIIGYGASGPEPGADYVIVLGAQVRGRTPSYNLARRLDKAYEYLKENPETKVILSGGQGEGELVTEAQAMAKYLKNKGLLEKRMILEEESENTYENIKFSREKIEKQEADIVLVTNNFHVFRSLRIARRQGVENVEGLGAPVMWYTVPNLYLREAFAVIKYMICGQI